MAQGSGDVLLRMIQSQLLLVVFVACMPCSIFCAQVLVKRTMVSEAARTSVLAERAAVQAAKQAKADKAACPQKKGRCAWKYCHNNGVTCGNVWSRTDPAYGVCPLVSGDCIVE